MTTPFEKHSGYAGYNKHVKINIFDTGICNFMVDTGSLKNCNDFSSCIFNFQVSMSVSRVNVCLCNCGNPTFCWTGEFWLKSVFLILAYL